MNKNTGRKSWNSQREEFEEERGLDEHVQGLFSKRTKKTSTIRERELKSGEWRKKIDLNTFKRKKKFNKEEIVSFLKLFPRRITKPLKLFYIWNSYREIASEFQMESV